MTLIEYHEEIRSAVFLANITLGTFIFAMKSFIVQTMKVEVYDTEEYQKEVIEPYRKTGENIGYYDSLSKLSSLLLITIVLSFVSGFLQVTLGFFANFWGIIACLGFALSAWVFVGISVYQVSENLQRMIGISEERAQNKEQSEKTSDSSQDSPEQ